MNSTISKAEREKNLFKILRKKKSKYKGKSRKSTPFKNMGKYQMLHRSQLNVDKNMLIYHISKTIGKL